MLSARRTPLLSPRRHATFPVRHVQRQWNELVATLRNAGAEVEPLEPHPGLPDLVFTADLGLVTGAVLLDIDGVLYVDGAAVPGAREALDRLQALGRVLLVTNTTSRSRAQVHEHLLALDFDVALEAVLTPAALAVNHCRQRGHRRVSLLVADALREDLAELEEPAGEEPVDAVVLGDIGDGFVPAVLDRALRQVLAGAELVALQHNRLYRKDGELVLDVGAYAAALEYGSGRGSTVVGKPNPRFFREALAELGAQPADAVMVGDDVEADIAGAMEAGLSGILVRTGKFRADLVAESGVTPTAVVDSIADVPNLLVAWRTEGDGESPPGKGQLHR